MEQERQQIIFINILKSIACLCVLTGHVINGMIKDGMEVAALLRVVNSYVYLFHVPCFFFASGYLYANKHLDMRTDYPRFVFKKFVTLGLPYFVCGTAYVLLSSVISADMHTAYSFDAILGLWVAPVAQYWYLYALFEMFLVVPVVELVFRRVGKEWILLLFIVCALCLHTEAACLTYLMSYTCFFYLGVYFNDSDIPNRVRSACPGSYLLLGVSCAAGIGIYIAYRSVGAGNLLTVGMNDILKGIVRLLLVVSVVGASLAIAGMRGSLTRFLVWLSQYSLYIYLFHTWFTGTLRIVLRRAGVLNSWTQAVCGIAAGLACSLAAAVIIKRIPFLRFWFEPLRVIRMRAEIRR